MSTTLWQAVIALSQAPVEAGWLGIAFALGAVASFAAHRLRAGDAGAALPVEDDELAFVEEVVSRASRPPREACEALATTSVPPPLPRGERPVGRVAFAAPSPPSAAAPAGPDEDLSTVIDLKLSDLLEQLEQESAGPGGVVEDDEYQTRAWSRSQLTGGLASTVAAVQPEVAQPEAVEPRVTRLPRAAVRAVDVAAVRRRLSSGRRA